MTKPTREEIDAILSLPEGTIVGEGQDFSHLQGFTGEDIEKVLLENQRKSYEKHTKEQLIDRLMHLHWCFNGALKELNNISQILAEAFGFPDGYPEVAKKPGTYCAGDLTPTELAHMAAERLIQ